MRGLLVTIGIKKAFDSLDHLFLRSVLKKPGFGGNVITWIENVTKNHKFWIINSSKTTLYFKLKKGLRQGDPISVYLLILTFEVLLYIIKIIISIITFYTQFTLITKLCFRNKQSNLELVKTFYTISSFSGLKSNSTKC